MKKLNLICASIAVLCATTAGAGTLTTAGTVFATENFGPTFPADGAGSFVRPGAITYSLSTITAVNASATVYFTVRLVGAKFDAAPAGTTFNFAGQAAGVDIGARTLSDDRTTVQVAVTALASVNIGLGAFTYTPGVADINEANTTLATSGGKIEVSIGLNTIAATSAGLDSTNAQPTVDLPLPLATAASSTNAIITTISKLPDGGVTDTKIDLTASPAGSSFTAGYGGAAPLGVVKFANRSGTQAQAVTSTVDYTLLVGSAAAPNNGYTVTVTPGAGQSFPINSTLFLSTGTACGAAVGATSGSGTVAFTAGNVSTAKVLTTTTAATTGTEYTVCLNDPGALSSVNQVATPITVTLAAELSPAAATDAKSAGSGTGYALDYNGSNVEVTSYWPGALDAFSYKGYLKITNSGSVSAVVTGQHRNDAGALVGTAMPLNVAGKLPGGTLAAGQSVLLSTKEIDAVLGANPSGLSQGRLRLTAPTNALRVQSLLQTGDDAPIEYSTQNGI